MGSLKNYFFPSPKEKKVVLSLVLALIIITMLLFSACSVPSDQQAEDNNSSSLPASSVEYCSYIGTIGVDNVPVQTQGFSINFRYYLPPCYKEKKEKRFPVIYLLKMPYDITLSDTENTPMSLSERLIHAGKLPPVIIIVPESVPDYGYHVALAKDLVSYVDKKFRTLTDRNHRGVGGISYGAAVAARMGFEFPDLFGSVGLLSGGIDISEQERFSGWINKTPKDKWPRVLIKVGKQDTIHPLVYNLTEVLEDNDFRYTLDIGQGAHTWIYWSSQMESYLLWFAKVW